MGLNCGIVGLPNVGKSTIFQALTSAPAEVANYPFCTIDPNVGIVNIPDERLYQISQIVQSKKIIPAIVEFVDIAGLVRGASKGEGLGNKFLAHIREVGVLIQVVRCFDNTDIVHVENSIDPVRDMETINIELALADLETLDKRLAKTEKAMKTAAANSKERDVLNVMYAVREVLQQGKPVRSLNLDEESVKLIKDLQLITMKKQIYVCNVDEDAIFEDNDYVKRVRQRAKEENAEVVVICGKLESEIAALDNPQDKADFLEAAGLKESGLNKLIHTSYNLLGLRTYFTAGPIEARAWTFKDGDKAPQAAGVIHTDFEKGFIKAEVYHCKDLFDLGSEQKVKEAGKLRIEGKEYVVKDGDVMHFRFNV